MPSYSEAAELTEKVTLQHTTYDIQRLYRLVDLSSTAAHIILDDMDIVDYMLPSTALVLSEAALRLSELNERVHEAMTVAMYYQGDDDDTEATGEDS